MMNWRLSAWSLMACALAGTSAGGSLRADDKNDPAGTWIWSREIEGQTNRSALKLANKDGKLTGTYHRSGQTVPISNGKFEKGEISFEAEGKFNEQKIHAKFHGKLSQNEIHGNIDIMIEDNSLPLPWAAKRGVALDDVVGTWKLKLDANGNPIESTLKLSADGDTLKGTYAGRFGEHPANDLTLKGDQLSWKIEADSNGQKFKGVYKAKLEGNAIKGNLEYDLDGNTGTLEFTGERGQAKAEAGKPNGSNAPKSDEKPAEKSSRLAAPKSLAIVSLKGRDEILTVHYVGPRKVTFSVFSLKGKPIANDISLKTLQASYPAIYKAYRTSYADAWATND